MKRRLLNLLTALSLLLCVAAVALWVRSRFVSEQLTRVAQTLEDGNREAMGERTWTERSWRQLHWTEVPVRLFGWGAGQNRGVIRAWVARHRLSLPHGVPHVQIVWDFESLQRRSGWTRGPARPVPQQPRASFFQRLGFHGSYKRDNQAGAEGFEAGVSVPHWFVLLGFLLLPAVRLGASLRWRARGGPGHCPTCGYDLRATPDRCPECGKAPD